MLYVKKDDPTKNESFPISNVGKFCKGPLCRSVLFDFALLCKIKYMLLMVPLSVFILYSLVLITA